METTRGRTLGDFQKDRALRSAVEREFITIGEALRQAASIEPDIVAAFTGGQDIIEFRHVLVHGYRRVEAATVWGVATDDLQVLLAEIDALLDSAS